MGIFISHTHGDQPIAVALSRLVRDLFANKIPVEFSTDPERDGGPEPGAIWFNWIIDRVRNGDLAFIVLTPSSIQKPWVLWEAGAVAGAAYVGVRNDAAGAAVGVGGDRRVYPITFGLGTSDVPGPFSQQQLVDGTSAVEIRKLTRDLQRRFDAVFSNDDRFAVGERWASCEKAYLDQLTGILHQLPQLVTESIVQEWLQRLDELERSHRLSEAAVLEDWLDIFVGRKRADRKRPIDLRLHRKLGEVYAQTGQHAAAARQFELAQMLAPRDIFILRRLGKAYLDMGNREAADAVIKQMESLDPEVFVRNPENAAFKARRREDEGDLLGAAETLQKAYDANPKSYYLGDRLGQIYLKQGTRMDDARRVYEQVLTTIAGLSEHNVWSIATALGAAIALKRDDLVENHLEALRALRPSVEERESMWRGVAKIARAVGLDPALEARVRQQIAGER